MAEGFSKRCEYMKEAGAFLKIILIDFKRSIILKKQIKILKSLRIIKRNINFMIMKFQEFNQKIL